MSAPRRTLPPNAAIGEVERDHGRDDDCVVPVYLEWGRDGDGSMGLWAWCDADVCPDCGRALDKAEQAEIERAACDAIYDAASDRGCGD